MSNFGPTNADRAEWADRALQMFQMVTGTERVDVYADLLCDLMHLAEAEGVDFARELRKAEFNYEAELEEAAELGQGDGA